MKDPYGYRPYRGSRVRRRGILINTLLAIAIAVAALWVLCLLLPLDEDGLRFPGQEEEPAAVTAPPAADEDSSGSAADNADGNTDAGNGDAPGDPPGTENGTGPVETDSGTGHSDVPDTQQPDMGNQAAAAPDTESNAAPTVPDQVLSSSSGYLVTPEFLRKNIAKAGPRWGALPEQPRNNHMVLLSAETFVRDADRLIALYQAGTISGAAVTVKDERGILYYPSAIPEVQGNRLILQPVDGFAETVSRLREAGLQLTAVLYTHCDDRYPRRDERIALQNINGVGWRDGAMRIYLDPANAQATAYLTAVAAELEGLGFRELLLRGVGYPTDGWLARIAYPEDRFGVVTGFVTAMRAAAPLARVSVWLDTPGVADNPDNGQSVIGLYAASYRLFVNAPGDGDAAAVQSQVTAVTGDSDALVVCVRSTGAAAALPASLLDLPLDALG